MRAGRALHRATALLLLLVLGSDLALHLGEPLLAQRSAPSDSGAIGARHFAAHSDESNCPIPGHSGSLFHHHHFPGIITSPSEIAPVSVQRILTATLAASRGSALAIIHPGRAPPLA